MVLALVSKASFSFKPVITAMKVVFVVNSMKNELGGFFGGLVLTLYCYRVYQT